MPGSFSNLDTYTDTTIISSGDFYAHKRKVTLVSGAGSNLMKNGYVIGKITASGKYNIYDTAAVDGSEVAAAVLSTEEDIDTSGGDVEAWAYFTGIFNSDNCQYKDTTVKVVTGNFTEAEFVAAIQKGIFFENQTGAN